MEILINGPINVLRLEGNINNIQKIIYLFADVHIKKENETKCESNDSIDIVDFYNASFKNIANFDKYYDFFFEIGMNETGSLDVENEKNNNKYIVRVKTLFLKNLNKNNDNTFKNIRFHYFDIRYHFNTIISFILSSLADIISGIPYFNNELFNKSMNSCIKLLTTVKNIITFIIDNLKNPKSVKIKNHDKYSIFIEYLSTEEFIDLLNDLIDENNSKIVINFKNNIKYLINKMLKKYNYSEIRSKINEYVDQFLIPYLDKTINRYNELTNILTIIKNVDSENSSEKDKIELVYNIQNNLNTTFYNYIIPSFAFITDIYFIRRFLDKDYITNGIVYAGVLHISNYIYILVNLFDFKITNMSKNYTNNINEKINNLFLTEKDKNIVSQIDNIIEIIKPHKDEMQCSDFTNFPKNFN